MNIAEQERLNPSFGQRVDSTLRVPGGDDSWIAHNQSTTCPHFARQATKLLDLIRAENDASPRLKIKWNHEADLVRVQPAG